MITDRLGRIKSPAPPNPEQIYAAIQRVRTVINRIDNGQDAWLHSSLNTGNYARDDARAFMWALAVIVEVCEIDDMTLNAIANRVWKGWQDALDFS